MKEKPADRRIGITTTVPAEIIYAAGLIPVDINNIFITSDKREKYIAAAERAGYPRTVCGWIKGIYGAVAAYHEVNQVIAVTEGDCSQTHALMETLADEGLRVLPFSYPFDRDPASLRREMEKLADALGTTWNEAVRQQERLAEARRPVWEIDKLTWAENKVSGWENHYWQISCSDFEGDPELFAARARDFLYEARQRPSRPPGLRMAFIGVPPIIDGLYEFFSSLNAEIIFNEVQRQFSLPYENVDLVEQYLRYTYPYDAATRAADIEGQLKIRRADAVIHYTQSFCFRQIEDILFRKWLKLPFLSIEGDAPGPLDARIRMRIETFLMMLGA